MTPGAFIAKWQASDLKESSASQEHFIDLCRLLGELFVRLADPDHHREAITSRPLLLHGVARQTRHGAQTRLTVTSHHARRSAIVAALRRISILP